MTSSNLPARRARRRTRPARPEQRGADDAACLQRQGAEVGGDQPFRPGPGRVEQALAVHPAVAEGQPLVHRVDPVGRGDQRRAVGGGEPALHRPAGLHQLRGDHDVDLARRGEQAEHGLGTHAADLAGRVQLDVVDGGAGALGDPGHRGGLRVVAGLPPDGDDPVGEHATALPAHGEDGDGDRTASAGPAGHAGTASYRAARFSTPVDSNRVQLPRVRARTRSRRVGLCTRSVR